MNATEVRLQQAESLLELGRVEQATALLKQVLAADPDHHRSRQILALAQLRAGDPGLAAETIEVALAQRPDDSFNHHLYADALRRLDRRPEAIAAAREAIRLAPDNWGPHATLAWTLPPGKEARAAGARALELGPDKPGAYLVMAHVSMPRKALAVLQRGLAIAPDNAELLAALYESHVYRSRPVAALNIAAALASAHPTAERLRLRLIQSSWTMVATSGLFWIFAGLAGILMVADKSGPNTPRDLPPQTPWWVRLIYSVLVFSAFAGWLAWISHRLTPAAKVLLRAHYLRGVAGPLALGGALVPAVTVLLLPFADQAADANWVSVPLLIGFAGLLTTLGTGLIWPSLLESYRESRHRSGMEHQRRRSASVWSLLAIYPVLLCLTNCVSGALGDRPEELALSLPAALGWAAGLLVINIWSGVTIYRRMDGRAVLRQPAGIAYAALGAFCALTPGWLPFSRAFGPQPQFAGAMLSFVLIALAFVGGHLANRRARGGH